jgi:1-acyl-sn-glycerol-3-phosphate acyltransferase
MEKEAKQPRDLYKVLYPIVKFALNLKYQHEVINTHNILEEPAIYAANHIHAADSPLISEAYTETTGLPLRFVMKEGYAEGKGVDDKGKHGRLAKFVTKYSLQIPVSREGMDTASYALFSSRVADTLERGDSVGIHPEATRSKDGRLHKFKSGAARLAIDNCVPIVPVGLIYTSHSNSRKQDVKIIFGEPINPEDFNNFPYNAIPGKKAKSEHLSQILENRVTGLTGMDQSGVFAKIRELKKD